MMRDDEIFMRSYGYRKFIVSLLLAGFTLRAETQADWDRAGKSWWRHVQYLASDKLEGRNIGSAGYEKAAVYVADQFQLAGLQPAGSEGYFQPVAFIETTLDANASSLQLVRNGRATRIAVPGEAQLGYSQNSGETLSAPVVFAGYGLVIPEAHWDDLKDLPIRGAVVAFLTGGPDRVDGNLRSHYSSGEERWKALRARGAVGVISISNPRTMEIPWSRQAASWGMPHVSLADPALQTNAGQQFGASWDPAKGDDLLAGSGHTFAEILAAADKQRPLPHFSLPSSVKARVRVSNRQIRSKNIAGVMRGKDERLRNQYVVVSAHLDHLGIGKPVHGDSIYNGAMDDASGIASLIEIAAALRDTRSTTKRSILFLAVTGEEKGELGSTYFAAHPTVKGPLVADINMDMFLPLFPLHWLEVQGLNESTLGETVTQVAQAAGLKVQADKEPNRNRFIRSDQYSFIKKGVPALAFKFGYVPGGVEEAKFKDWYTNRYHGVKDDLDQPVDLAAAAQFNAILRALSLRVANAPDSPHWNANSFFRRFATGRT
jgi:Peptidase family M28